MENINAIVTKGHRVASGKAKDSPYPEGTIKMQTPIFMKLGVNLADYFEGTLNLSIAPHTFQLGNPEFTLKKVQWADGFATEDFSFSYCEIVYKDKSYKGLIYYPHPETKIGHHHSQSLIEVICHDIPGIKYGESVTLLYNGDELAIN